MAERVDDYVRDFLNEEFEDDIKALGKVGQVLKNIQLQQVTDEEHDDNGIGKEDDDQDAPWYKLNIDTQFKSTLNAAVQNDKAAATLLCESGKVRIAVDKHLNHALPRCEKLNDEYVKVRELERVNGYLKLIIRCNNISTSIGESIKKEDWSESARYFSILSNVSSLLEESKCVNLKSFVNSTVIHWYKILKEHLARDFSCVLEWYGWPYISSSSSKGKLPAAAVADKGNNSKVSPSQAGKRDAGSGGGGENTGEEMRLRLRNVFTQLIQLQLPDDLLSTCDDSSPDTQSPSSGMLPSSIILPLQLMLQPLLKRFLFHFYGKRQTNRIDKPEWYMSQVLTWIRDNTQFLHDNIQPLLSDNGLRHVSAEREFTLGCVRLCVHKLSGDVAALLDAEDDLSLSHTISEVLLCQQELNLLTSPHGDTSMLTVLCDDDCFNKWIDIERKYATEKVDTLLCSEDAWQYKVGAVSADTVDGRDTGDSGTEDDVRVPQCVDTFITMVALITDRYKQLPYAEQRLQFISLQLELLDDFRVRLLQLSKQEARDPLHSNYCVILNAVTYIHLLLIDWNDKPFYVQQLYYKHQFDKLHEALHDAEQQGCKDDEQGSPPAAASSRQVSIGDSGKVSSGRMMEGQVDLSRGIFDDIIALYRHMREEMISTLVNCVVYDVKAKSGNYKRDRWMSAGSHKEYVSLSLSNTACPWLLLLQDRLHYLHNQLAHTLFTRVWQAVATHLNHYILEEVIYPNHFSEGGAMQLEFDMTRNLFPLFAQYSKRPADNYFKDIKEACILLTVSKGSALLLRDAIATSLYTLNIPQQQQQQQRASGGGGGVDTGEPSKVLREMGVYKLPLDACDKILALRTDLTML